MSAHPAATQAPLVLHIVDSLKIGGAETLLLDLVDAAAARGWRAHVAHFTPGPLAQDLSQRGVGVTRLSEAGLRDPRAVLRARTLIRRLGPDVVHTHLTKSDLVGQTAARMVPGVRRVATVHNVDPWRRRPLLSRVWRAAVGGARIVAVSEGVASFLAETGGARREHVAVIDNGVDLSRFRPGAPAIERTRLGATGDDILVAAIGRLEPQKDHETYIAAAAIALREEPRLRFILVGDGTLRERLAAQAAAASPEGRITLAGVVRDMPGLLSATDIVAFSSAWEGLPMALLEAMAAARPIAATAVGGVPDAVSDGREALLAPPRDPARLAAAILRIARDPELADRLGAAAREAVAARHSAEAMLSHIFSLYGAPAGEGSHPTDARVPA